MGPKSVHQLYNSVNHIPGMGASGRIVSIVEQRCDRCGHDRMVEEQRISPVYPEETEYSCQNPCCPEYHDNRLGIPRL